MKCRLESNNQLRHASVVDEFIVKLSGYAHDSQLLNQRRSDLENAFIIAKIC